MKPTTPANFSGNWIFSWIPGDERRQAAKNQPIWPLFSKMVRLRSSAPWLKKWVADFGFPLAVGAGCGVHSRPFT